MGRWLSRFGTASWFVLAIGCTARGVFREPYPYGFVWRDATLPCKPVYPPQSIGARHEGLGVLAIDFDEQGVSTRAHVLEAPDEHITASLLACGAAFRAGPRQDGQRTLRRGKLFAYFLLDGEKGVVFVVNDSLQKSALLDSGLAEKFWGRKDRSTQ